MRSALRGTLVFAASSGVSILVGLLVTRLWAQAVGPEGVGRSAVLQGLIGMTSLVGSLGLGTALVQMGAERAASGRVGEFRALVAMAWSRWRRRAAATCVMLGTAGLAWALLVRRAIGPLDVGVIILGYLFASAAQLMSASATARRRTARQVGYQVGSILVGGGLGAGVVLALGAPGIPWAVLAHQVGLWIVGCWASSDPDRAVPAEAPTGLEEEYGRTTRAFGLGLAASSSIPYALPSIVAAVGGEQVAGFWRAAFMIPSHLFGLIGNALSQRFQTDLVVKRGDEAALRSMVRAQYGVVLLLATAAALAAIPVSGWILRVCFSDAFLPAELMFDLFLAGGLFRIVSYVFAFMVLSLASRRAYAVLELVGTAGWLLGTWGGYRLWGAPGLGAGFLGAYLVYLGAAAVLARRALRPMLSVAQWASLALSGALVAGLVFVKWQGQHSG